ncbi:ATP-binding protein [Weissella confusa]|uniref:ATP-binding protein n=1 Tax=Weissella confusa TaxID=1583 RepID=UPI0021AE42F2|nr:ATP-binding protein [Weissella confusa]MCT0949975.1 ATP-binding protein [Weissella confusa]
MRSTSEWMAELKKRGLSVKTMTPEERAEKEIVDAQRITAEWQAQERTKYARMSLWGETQERLFQFSNWEPAMQQNELVARDIGNKAYKIAKELRDGLFNVFLYGQAGAGKTSLALAIADVVKDKYTTMFVSVVEWRSMKFKSFNDNSIAERLNVVERFMKEVDVLILDDFGKETQTEAKETVSAMLFELADARRGKATLITSNDNLAGLSNKYDAATLSRLITKDTTHTISTNKLADVRKV